MLLLVQVEQTPGGSGQHIKAGTDGVHLRLLAHAAEYDVAGQGQVTTVIGHTLAYLCGKLARWRENQRANLALARAWAIGQTLQHRQGKTGGLAGAGLSAGQQIATFKHGGNGLELDRCGGGVALGFDSTQQFDPQAEFGKKGHAFSADTSRPAICDGQTISPGQDV